MHPFTFFHETLFNTGMQGCIQGGAQGVQTPPHPQTPSTSQPEAASSQAFS